MAKHINGMFKMSFLTADWHSNLDGRLFNPDPDYNDGIDHSLFIKNITFFNFGFAVEIGK